MLKAINNILSKTDKVILETFLSLKSLLVNNFSFSKTFLFLILSIFLGWNGLQILIYLNTMLSLYNSYSLNTFLFNLVYINNSLIPIYIFFIITFVAIFFWLHSISEVFFNEVFIQKKIKLKKKIFISLNFFVPNVIIFFLASLLMGLSLFFVIQVINLLNSFNFNIHLHLYRIVNHVIVFLFTSSIIISIILKDNLIPHMLNGKSFLDSLSIFTQMLKKKFYIFLFYYLLKSLMISFSLLFFWLIITLIVNPAIQYITDHYFIALLLHNNGLTFIEDAFANILSFLFISSIYLIVFSPIQFFFLMFLKILQNKLFFSSSK